MQRPHHVPDRDRLSVLTAIILLAFALARTVELPTQAMRTMLFGSSIGLDLNGPFVLLVLVAVLISAGADSLMRSHPALREASLGRRMMHWILPGGAALGLGLLLNRLPPGVGWWAGLAFTAVFLVLVLVAEYIVVAPDDASFYWAALGLTVLAYGVALAFFGLLRASGGRAAITATAAALVSALVALRLLLLAGATGRESLPYAGAIGLCLGECTWAMGYWPAGPLGTGLMLLVVFYTCTGLAQQHLVGALSRRMLLEFGVVAVVGLVAVLRFALPL
jgi:Protein of unknown function (DUF5656)